MSKELKLEMLLKLQTRYAGRKVEGKTRLLDEVCEDFGYERKYAIKLLGNRLVKAGGQGPPGPAKVYEVIEPVVREIWRAAEQPCGKRLAPILRLWLPFYESRHGRLSVRQRELLRGLPWPVQRVVSGWK